MKRHISPLGVPEMILDRKFEDMHSFGSALGGWDLDFRQLDAGRLRAHVTVIAGHRSAVLRVAFNRRLHQLGSPPPGTLVFGLPEHPTSWCGVETIPGDLLNFNLQGGFDGVSAAGFRGTVLLLEQGELERGAADLGLEIDLRDELSTRSSWKGSGLGSRRLSQSLARLRNTLTSPEGRSAAHELIGDVAPRVVAWIFAEDATGGERSDPKARQEAVRTAVEILDSSERLPVTVSDLCRVAGVSAPTMYRAFQDTFGISPKQYLRAWSLSGVRDDLVVAEPQEHVIDIANRWGFWHMGQFAADYRRQFGELPSETLQK